MRAGVWYYDALHTYEAQLEGLRIAEALLAPGALLIVDDTDWEQVERAMDDYLAEQPRARRILTIDGKDRGFPQWWEGMQVLAGTEDVEPPSPRGGSGRLTGLYVPRIVNRRLSTTPLMLLSANVAV